MDQTASEIGSLPVDAIIPWRITEAGVSSNPQDCGPGSTGRTNCRTKRSRDSAKIRRREHTANRSSRSCSCGQTNPHGGTCGIRKHIDARVMGVTCGQVFRIGIYRHFKAFYEIKVALKKPYLRGAAGIHGQVSKSLSHIGNDDEA